MPPPDNLLKGQEVLKRILVLRIDSEILQDPKNVAETVRFLLTQPSETVIPEIMVLPMRETSWP